jgi:hypothetical protein
VARPAILDCLAPVLGLLPPNNHFDPEAHCLAPAPAPAPEEVDPIPHPAPVGHCHGLLHCARVDLPGGEPDRHHVAEEAEAEGGGYHWAGHLQCQGGKRRDAPSLE